MHYCLIQCVEMCCVCCLSGLIALILLIVVLFSNRVSQSICLCELLLQYLVAKPLHLIHNSILHQPSDQVLMSLLCVHSIS